MKKTLIGLSFAFLIHSCCLLPFERTWTDEYIIENNTGYLITIYYRYETYSDVPEIKLDTIEIMPNSEYVDYGYRGFDYDFPELFSVTTDSVVIQFDNKREIIQTCEHFFNDDCMIERNVINYLNSANYTKKIIGRECGDKEYRYTYTIKEEDYNNAVPIID